MIDRAVCLEKEAVLGVEIVLVPPDWRHPVDEDGELVVGAHHEPLYELDDAAKTAFQLYENVSEGSPISPVFGSRRGVQSGDNLVRGSAFELLLFSTVMIPSSSNRVHEFFKVSLLTASK